MTLALALLILLTLPMWTTLLRQFPHRRGWAFAAVAALPFMPDLPLSGYLFGWPLWQGTSRGFNISVLDMLALALIITRRKVPAILPFWGLIGFYGLTLCVSVVFATTWLASVFSCWQYLRVILIFFAIGGEGHNPKVHVSVWSGFAIGLLYQAGFVVFQKMSGVLQAAGTIGHQNVLGMMVELTLLPLIAALLAGYRSKLVILGIIAALACVAGSGSRATAGIVGASIVTLSLLSLIRRSTPTKIKIVGLGAVVLMIATPLVLANLNQRFNGGSFVTEEGTRASLEEAARAMAADNPLGVGANQFVFESNVGNYADRAGVSWNFQNRSIPVHNAYLLARAETGWAGQGALLLLMLVPLFRAMRLTFASPRLASGDMVLGAAVALVAVSIHSNFEYALHTYPVQAFLFVNLGLIAAMLRDRRLALAQSRPRRLTARQPIHARSTEPVANGG